MTMANVYRDDIKKRAIYTCQPMAYYNSEKEKEMKEIDKTSLNIVCDGLWGFCCFVLIVFAANKDKLSHNFIYPNLKVPTSFHLKALFSFTQLDVNFGKINN